MKTQYVVALATLVGIGVGAFTIEGLHAQAKPLIYLIEEIDVSDPDAFQKEFGPKIQAANKAASVRALVAGGKVTVIEGAPPKSRVVVQVWDSVERMQAFRNSAEYKEARKIGDKYATFRTFAVEGLPQ
jgi:uncharacterized protein (DUF1330 family)